MGTVSLPAGPVRLTLQALAIPGHTACELRGLRLERLPERE
jgi:hypothetical protein